MFRVKMNPVIVEAKQYQVGKEQEIIDWIASSLFKMPVIVGDGYLMLKGGNLGYPGDWVIRSIEGPFYVCPRKAFESLYVKENADVAV